MIQERKQKEQTRKQRLSSQFAGPVNIHCRSCNTFLCKATSLRSYCNNYICIDPEFELKVKFTQADEPLEFRFDRQVGWYCSFYADRNTLKACSLRTASV